jgi:two-component system, OmpR family, sensor histidine kinase BaeS
MRISLSLKLILFLLMLSLLSVGLVGFFAKNVTSNEFDRFRLERDQTTFLLQLTDYYRNQGSWQGIDQAMRLENRPPQNRPQNGTQNSPQNRTQDPVNPPARGAPPFVLTDLEGLVLLPGGGFRIGETLPPNLFNQAAAVQVAGITVGKLLTLEQPPQLDAREQDFLQRINRALLLATLGTMLLAVLLGWLFSKWLLKPLQGLIAGLHSMRRGELQQHLSVRSSDEIGELVQTFNQMSSEIAQAHQLRKQMTADIAHDLKTPLTVILGHLEGLREGVLQPSAKRFNTLYWEAKQLERLISDLRLLSLSDAGELHLELYPTPLTPMLHSILHSFEHVALQSQIQLSLELPPTLPLLNLDASRFTQILTNLLDNALRHTPEGGTVILGARAVQHGVHIWVQDTGQGIPAEKLPHIFERFYRADSARSLARSLEGVGGSGLGLAICKSLLEAHGGRIWAESEQGKGSCFWLEVPLGISLG